MRAGISSDRNSSSRSGMGLSAGNAPVGIRGGIACHLPGDRPPLSLAY
jgi:hypothetical protein